MKTIAFLFIYYIAFAQLVGCNATAPAKCQTKPRPAPADAHYSNIPGDKLDILDAEAFFNVARVE